MAHLEEVVPLVRRETGLNVAVSAGILDDDQARRLAAAGTHRYNHNLETARSHFPHIVTTHTWEERFATCQLVRRTRDGAVLRRALGMGESDEQRIELLGQLREAGPAEVPLNFLDPRPGTPLAGRPLVAAREAIRWIALFRLALPDVILRYAGGREVTLGELQEMGMTAGINALIVGNYLTTLGRAPQEDLVMLDNLRMPIGHAVEGDLSGRAREGASSVRGVSCSWRLRRRAARASACASRSHGRSGRASLALGLRSDLSWHPRARLSPPRPTGATARGAVLPWRSAPVAPAPTSRGASAWTAAAG